MWPLPLLAGSVAKEGILLSFEALHELRFVILNAIPLSLLCHMEFFLQVNVIVHHLIIHATAVRISWILYESVCGFPMTESVSKSEACTAGASWELQFAMKSSCMVSLLCVPMRKVLVIWSMHSTNKVDFNVAPFNSMVEWCWSVKSFFAVCGRMWIMRHLPTEGAICTSSVSDEACREFVSFV